MSDYPDKGAHTRFELLFENAPVAIWLEDFSTVHEYLLNLTHDRRLSLATVFEARPDTVAECVRRVRIIHVNRQARAFYQAETVRQIADQFTQLFDAQTLQTFRQELLAFWDNHSSFEADILTPTLPGVQRLVKMSCAILPDQSAPWSFVIVTFTDLTERHEFEESLRQSERRATSAAEELRRTNTILARLNTDLERFAYSAAHDLREPLRTISLYTQLLMQFDGPKLTSHGETAVRFILEGTRRMERLIKDLLGFAHATEPKPGDTKAVSDFTAVLSETLQTLDAAIRESNTSLHLERLPPLAVDPGHLRQLLQNLISNAIKYRGTSRRLEITITGQVETNRVTLCVADNGTGIKPEYQHRIFEIFQRLHGQEIQGSGIGLALCRRIAGIYGGRIWVESDGASGSAFYVELPRLRES
ncbi:MAG: ATP-binding protein [Bryobacteraceae bacterium]|nr:ATP-binding protein [Bryobacteraceae bacterium]